MTNRTALAGGQVVAARYELVRSLAAGHDGATWLARDTHANGDVVLRFRAGGAAAGEGVRAVVDHATLLAPLATHDAGDESFDVFEYLPGGEIGRLRGRSWTLIARRLLPVIDALSQLHASGLGPRRSQVGQRAARRRRPAATRGPRQRPQDRFDATRRCVAVFDEPRAARRRRCGRGGRHLRPRRAVLRTRERPPTVLPRPDAGPRA